MSEIAQASGYEPNSDEKIAFEAKQIAQLLRQIAEGSGERERNTAGCL